MIEAKKWAHLRTVAKITRRRTAGRKATEEAIYYISDLGLDPEKIARPARERWGVENGLQHALDVVLSESNHIYRYRSGAANLSAIRKIVLHLLESRHFQTLQKQNQFEQDVFSLL